MKATLRSRLRNTMLALCAGAVVLACSAFLLFDHLSFRRATEQRLASLGGLLGNSSAVALSVENEKLAARLLQALASQPSITSACIYDKAGAAFAQYARAKAAGPLPASRQPDGFTSTEGHIEFWQTLRDADEPVGTLYLRSDLNEGWERLRLNSLVIAFILASVLLGTLAFTERFVKVITGPIAGLAEVVKAITSRRDYSIRAEKRGPAELEVLIDGMNDMLSQIQVRDGALQLARSELENRVEERTAELRFLNDELSNEIKERRRIEGSLRENERTMRTLVDYAPDAIVILDVATGRFVDANQNAERLYGIDRSRLLTLGPSDVSPPVQPNGRRSSELAFEKIQQAVAGGLPAYEWTHVDAGGRLIPCEVHLVRLPVADRTLVRGSIMDITRRKEMDRLKDEFVSTVSHELRTPITSIQGSLGLIANGVLGTLPAAAKPLVDVAYKNCQRLVLLINDILDSEKIAAGKMKFSFKLQDLMPLVEHSVEANRGYAAQFGVSLQLAGGADGIKVEVDADRLVQVLTNLISNASKFSPRGGVVKVSVTREKGAKVRIAVADQGPGIPEEFRSRIFQKFSQADSSDTRQKGGTGLGLSISRAIVEKHNGSLFFETETGRGTTFYADLPEAAAATSSGPKDAPPPGAARILVCDDDLQVGQYIQTVLEQEGYAVEIAQGGDRTLSLLAASRFDALLLDLILPDRDGISVLRELRATPHGRELPVILVSGEASTVDSLAHANLGVTATLDKPVDAQHLVAVMKRALAPKAGARSRVLHVEPDLETRRMVAYTLGTSAETTGVATLAEARAALQKAPFDLVVLNVDLPDGSGMELMPQLIRPGSPRIPAVAFNGSAHALVSLAGSFLKALAAHDDLPAPVRALVSVPADPTVQGVAR